ncbi:hypothetical protein ACU4GD_30245 [Cupriavidus basilensis]
MAAKLAQRGHGRRAALQRLPARRKMQFQRGLRGRVVAGIEQRLREWPPGSVEHRMGSDKAVLHGSQVQAKQCPRGIRREAHRASTPGGRCPAHRGPGLAARDHHRRAEWPPLRSAAGALDKPRIQALVPRKTNQRRGREMRQPLRLLRLKPRVSRRMSGDHRALQGGRREVQMVARGLRLRPARGARELADRGSVAARGGSSVESIARTQGTPWGAWPCRLRSRPAPQDGEQWVE